MMKVSKDRFEEFLKSYPNKLTSGLTTICEPPIRHYFDDKIETDAKLGTAEYFFAKVVASIKLDWLGPNEEIDRENHGRWWVYKIKELQNDTSTKA